LSKPLATVGVDVDPVDLHLAGYGYRGLPPDSLAYEPALPRLLAAFARAGVRATFFVVARDAAAQAVALAAIARAGHEIASHSLTHPMAFASLPTQRMRHELDESRRLLERACGEEVIGYRSPNFDLGERGMEALAACGYRYDASGYPSPFLLPARLLLALKSRDRSGALRLSPWPLTWRREPFRWNGRSRPLEEFPVSVTPLLRFPVYHTARYVMDERRFLGILDGFARRGEPLSYPMHAVDALGLREDRVDPKLSRHPGMERPLKEKLEILARTLEAIAARFQPVPFRDRLGGLTA